MRLLSQVVVLTFVTPAFAVEPDTHWSLRPRSRPVVPEVSKPKFAIRNPIDAFVLSRLEKEGLSPATEADRATLIRRVTFDLIGLPPTADDVDAFSVEDTRARIDGSSIGLRCCIRSRIFSRCSLITFRMPAAQASLLHASEQCFGALDRQVKTVKDPPH